MKKKSIAIFIASLFLILNGKETYASQLNFNVSPVLPDTQVDKEKSYFDLKLGADSEQVLTVVLKNGTDKTVTVESTINRATTNLNGVVEYGMVKDKKDSSLEYDIEDLVTITEPIIEIPANSEKSLLLKVKSPQQLFEGILTGGLTFKEVKSTESKEKEQTGLAIQNEYAYVLGIVLHGDKEDLPSKVSLSKVEASQVNARNVINATIQNPQAKYLNDLTVEAKVTRKDSRDVLYKSKTSDMQMAPNSHFSYPVPLNGDSLKAGTYTVTLKVSSLKDKWDFSKDFTINKEQADKLNSKDVTIKKNNVWFYIILIGVVFVTVLITLIFLIIRHKKKERKRKKVLDQRRRKIEQQRRRKIEQQRRRKIEQQRRRK